MYAINFTGRKLYNNINILGDPMQEKTNAEDDIKYLNSIKETLTNSDKTQLKRDYLGSSNHSFNCGDYHVSFRQDCGFTDYGKLFIKDCKENITRIFSKSEFSNHEYGKAFKNCVEIIRNSLSKV